MPQQHSHLADFHSVLPVRTWNRLGVGLTFCAWTGNLLAAAPPVTETTAPVAKPSTRLCTTAAETVSARATGSGHAGPLSSARRLAGETIPSENPQPIRIPLDELIELKPANFQHVPTPTGFLLDKWSEASRQSALSERDIQWIQRMNSPALSSHQLADAVRFLGKVSREDLETRYEWSVELEGGGIIELRGRPRDETEQLFAAAWEVTLLRERRPPYFRVDQIAMQSRDGSWQTVRLPEPARVTKIQLADHTIADDLILEALIPPSPRYVEDVPPTMIRFAGGTIEVELE